MDHLLSREKDFEFYLGVFLILLVLFCLVLKDFIVFQNFYI